MASTVNDIKRLKNKFKFHLGVVINFTLTGTGSKTFLFPAKSAKCLYKGTPFSAAAALETASETPRIAFAPSPAIKK